MTKKFFCFHGHFYQPPRECPWTGQIEKQPSAAPYDNWNARIDAECYAPNGRAHVVASDGTVIDIRNNYAWMSFNMGPTLLSWMRENEHADDTYLAIVEAARESVVRFGHPNPIAQNYNHIIMPLAHARDRKTQVVWGKADYQFRFGFEPEGMHCAETAMDTNTLEALAAEGIQFTILAPRQARRFRKIGETNWQEGGIDPSRAYRCNLPSGRSIVIFFYDGPISQAVAFEKLLSDGQTFLNRINSGFAEGRDHDQLVHLAVDGETVGHHHKQGEMCLAWLFKQLENSDDIEVVNYGKFLEMYPPQYEVEIWDNSSWSCAHGVERWRSDCGCKTKQEWHQQWRGPLRNGLNALREKLDELFDTEGRKYFADPWVARDAYIGVLLDSDTASEFIAQHCQADLGDDDLRKAFALMEMERFGMLMFTSCAWFFDEISGLEPTQNLRYAARAIQLAEEVSGQDFTSALLDHLKHAQSNLPDMFANGEAVWNQIIMPEAVVKQIRLLLVSELSSVEAVDRLSRLIADAENRGVKLDIEEARHTLLDAYARLVERESMTEALHGAFARVASQLKLAVKLLGWKKAGIPPAHHRVRPQFRRPVPRRLIHEARRVRGENRWRQ